MGKQSLSSGCFQLHVLALWSIVPGVGSLGSGPHPTVNKLCAPRDSSPLCALAGSKTLMPHHQLECRELDQLWDLGMEGSGKICLLIARSFPHHLSPFVHSALIVPSCVPEAGTSCNNQDRPGFLGILVKQERQA